VLSNIPQELRQLAQWVVWRYEKKEEDEKPTKVPYNANNGWKAESDNPQTWAPFETAVAAWQTKGFDGIGFMLSPSDPYAFIDLDTYDPKLTQQDRDRHKQIAEAFKGYAELSPSGQGLHLIVKGAVPQGRKRAGVELYSQGRYFTFTGNVWRDGPVIEQQELVMQLWSEMAPPNAAANNHQYVNGEQKESDYDICERASKALNGAKFVSLYRGDWKAEYPSQSEADFALVDILAFYTKNRDQIKRIFRASGLGQREKAQRDSYFDDAKYGMLAKAFDNQPPEVNLDALAAAWNNAQANPPPAAPPVMQPIVAMVAPNYLPPPDESGAYTLPEGLLGAMAQYIYQSAPRPVQEIALCGAIGLMAGIAGRSYNISGTGLNQYLMLLAPTGSGKEAIANGIAAIMSAVQRIVPASTMFVGPGQIRSDAALYKYMHSTSPSFVTVLGEFGHTLQQMASLNASSQMRGIKQALLDIYGKSGQGQILRPSIYSDRQNNTDAVLAPALTLIGESAPEPFYESVDERLIADGLLPRFTLVEYRGDRPDLNPWAGTPPSQQLIEQTAQLCAQCLMLNNSHNVLNVELTGDAKMLLDTFDRACTNEINTKGSRETNRHIWNRAHLRALKLAGLIAVGTNPYQPTVTLAQAEWAIALSMRNTKALMSRFELGDTGSPVSDDKQVREVRRVIKDYLSLPWDRVKSYAPSESLYYARIIPYSYVNKRLAATSAFRLDKRGSTNAMYTALKVLCDCGELVELNKSDIANRFQVTMRSFGIANPAAFL
jgi:hypothetical protein